MFWLLMLCCTPIHAMKCGECICTGWSQTLSCYGENVTELPHVPQWVTHVDIIQTNISTLPREEWPRVLTVDIMDNSHLQCSDILAWKKSRQGLRVLSACYEENYEKDQSLYWLNILMLIPVILGAVMYRLRRITTRSTRPPL